MLRGASCSGSASRPRCCSSQPHGRRRPSDTSWSASAARRSPSPTSSAASRSVPPFQLAELRRRLPTKSVETSSNGCSSPSFCTPKRRAGENSSKSPAIVDRLRELLRQAIEGDLRDRWNERAGHSCRGSKYFSDNREPLRDSSPAPAVADPGRGRGAGEEDHRASARAAKGRHVGRTPRARSLDKATAMRGGDLGFVRADGTTDVPRVRVDPAALRRRGQGEGRRPGSRARCARATSWAAIWRRGSLPEIKRTIEQEERSITAILTRKKLEDRRQALLDAAPQAVRARRQRLAGSRPWRSSTFGELGTRGAPASSPATARGHPAPSAGRRASDRGGAKGQGAQGNGRTSEEEPELRARSAFCPALDPWPLDPSPSTGANPAASGCRETRAPRRERAAGR